MVKAIFADDGNGVYLIAGTTPEELAAWELANRMKWTGTELVSVAIVPTEEERVAALWQAAHDYEYKEISGTGIGLLTIGVLQGLPKAVAVQGWSSRLWDLYYERRDVTLSSDCDFSVIGPIPHTIPELRQELGL